MKRRAFLATGVAGAAVPILAACNANKKSSSPGNNGGAGAGGKPSVAPTQKVTAGGTLYVLTDQSELDLDPAKSQNLATSTIHLVLRSLTTWKESNTVPPTVVPDLATTTGEQSDGGRTWTYKLKQGLLYADGKPITSKDIKYGVERSFSPLLPGGLAYHKVLLEGGDKYQGPYGGRELAAIETPDDQTIVFHLNKPFGDWPWIVSMPAFAPVPKAADKPKTYGQKPVASGPYQVQSVQQGKQTTFVRNPHWKKSTDPARTGGPDKIVYQIGLDDQVVNKRVISDQGNDQFALSSVTVQAALLPQVQADKSVESRMVVSQSGALTYLAMNTQRKPLSDPRLRKAIQYAVDKQAFQIASGGAQVGGAIASTLIIPGIDGYEKYNLYDAPPTGDVKKAKSLLKAAGYGKGLTLVLLTPNDSVSVSQAQAIQAGLRRAGIKVNLKQESSDAASADMTGDKPTYDLAISGWLPDYPSAAGCIQPLFASDQIGGGNYNIARYKNPAVDRKIDAALSTIDPKAAARLWTAVDKEIMADAPVVPLIYSHNAFLHGSKVENVFIPPYPPYVNYLVVGVQS